MNGIKSKKGQYGWRSMVVNHHDKTKTVGISCKKKTESRTAARVAEQLALKSQFGGSKLILSEQIILEKVAHYEIRLSKQIRQNKIQGEINQALGNK